MSQAASFRIIAAPRRSRAPVFLYSPLTAADEKIPLSVVRVNNKPQHLVFCWHFAHLLSKHRHLPVESCKRPCLTRRRAVCFALKSGLRVGPWSIPVPLSKVSPSRTLSQGAGVVQNRACPVRIVEIGDITELARISHTYSESLQFQGAKDCLDGVSCLQESWSEILSVMARRSPATDRDFGQGSASRSVECG